LTAHELSKFREKETTQDLAAPRAQAPRTSPHTALTVTTHH